MRRIALSLLAVVFLCSGQGCPSPTGTSTAVRPHSIIPAGNYAGDVTYTTAATVGGQPIPFEQPPASPYACEFGTDGYPLLGEGTSIDIGDKILATFDTDNDTTMTVKTIRSLSGGIAIDYGVVTSYQIQGQAVDATGTATESYKIAAGGGLDYTFDIAVDFMFETLPVHMTQSGHGRLTR